MEQNTALGATAEREGKIIFISDAHEKFYYEKLKEVRYQDVYHKALCYCLGICNDTRENAYRIYDFKTGNVKTERALFKVILPALAIGIWILTCYPVCNKVEGFDFFLFWILAGFPFGIRKMCMVLIPKNFGIAGSMGVLALNAVVGGLIGGVMLIIKVIGIAVELVKIIAGHFWTQCPEV